MHLACLRLASPDRILWPAPSDDKEGVEAVQRTGRLPAGSQINVPRRGAQRANCHEQNPRLAGGIAESPADAAIQRGCGTMDKKGEAESRQIRLRFFCGPNAASTAWTFAVRITVVEGRYPRCNLSAEEALNQ